MVFIYLWSVYIIMLNNLLLKKQKRTLHWSVLDVIYIYIFMDSSGFFINKLISQAFTRNILDFDSPRLTEKYFFATLGISFGGRNLWCWELFSMFLHIQGVPGNWEQIIMKNKVWKELVYFQKFVCLIFFIFLKLFDKARIRRQWAHIRAKWTFVVFTGSEWFSFEF